MSSEIPDGYGARHTGRAKPKRYLCLKEIKFLLNALCAVRSLLKVCSCLPPRPFSILLAADPARKPTSGRDVALAPWPSAGLAEPSEDRAAVRILEIIFRGMDSPPRCSLRCAARRQRPATSAAAIEFRLAGPRDDTQWYPRGSGLMTRTRLGDDHPGSNWSAALAQPAAGPGCQSRRRSRCPARTSLSASISACGGSSVSVAESGPAEPS